MATGRTARQTNHATRLFSNSALTLNARAAATAAAASSPTAAVVVVAAANTVMHYMKADP